MEIAMKLPLAVLALSLSLVAPAAADDDRTIRTLQASWATGGRTIRLDLPPGGIAIEAATDARLSVDFDVRCEFGRRGCEERAERLEVVTDVVDGSFRLRVEGMPAVNTRGLSLHGTIRVPKGARVEVDMGAGELKIRGLDNDLDVDLGAGEIKVRMAERAVRSVRVGVGVGEGSLAVAGRDIEGSGWLGHKVRWGDGPGRAHVNVSLGVGEARVTLE
jgi:hypothetical protein